MRCSYQKIICEYVQRSRLLLAVICNLYCIMSLHWGTIYHDIGLIKFRLNSVHQTPSCYISEHTSTSGRPDHMLCNGGPSGALINGRPSGHQSIHLCNDASARAGKVNVSTSMQSTQNLNLTVLNGMNGTMIKSEPSYSSNSEFTFYNDSSFLETHPLSGDAPGTSFSSSELSEQLLDVDTSSFGFLNQIPRNFSFSDLTEDFTRSADILESYGRSPFLAPETDYFSDSPRRECKGENGRLDTVSEGPDHDDFGSD